MVQLIDLSEGWRMFRRSLRIKSKGYGRYPGNAPQILGHIVNQCWNAKQHYYQVSNGNYPEFYCRDFGICTDALLALGHRDKIVKTLEYAMAIYSKHGKITQVISPKGIPFEFPYYSSDALPFILRSLNAAKAKGLIAKYKEFLNYEIGRYYELVFDEKTGLAKKESKIAGMRDHALRVSPCYHNCMIAMLKNEIQKAGLNNPFKKFDFKKIIKEMFWKDGYFIDDLSGNHFVTGDANVFPFWCNIFEDRKMMQSMMKKIRENGLDYPFPLRYYHAKGRHQKMIWQEIFVGDWENDTAWLHLGLCFLDVVKMADSQMYEFYLHKYAGLVEHYGNLMEVFTEKARPFETMFYSADEGMLWSSKLLAHLQGKV